MDSGVATANNRGGRKRQLRRDVMWRFRDQQATKTWRTGTGRFPKVRGQLGRTRGCCDGKGKKENSKKSGEKVEEEERKEEAYAGFPAEHHDILLGSYGRNRRLGVGEPQRTRRDIEYR